MKVLIISLIAAAFAVVTQGSEVFYHETEQNEVSTNAITNDAFAQSKSRGSECIATVFDKPNYRGRMLFILQQNANFKNDFFNDRVESIQIEGRCQWIFYEHTNFLGSAHVLGAGYHSSAPRWGGRGNHISSARVLPPQGTPAIVLFQHTNFQGRMEVLTSSNRFLPNIEFNDHVSSIIVTGGIWKAYKHSHFRGRWIRLKARRYCNIHRSRLGGDSLSSVKRISFKEEKKE